ncbi:MAG: hypothetical protein LBD23_15915 [Oscillospiraceae bacterium]|jgi:hypothetical protein|nr:hypothetical protein [Oscillospiraceae bacterium]
MSVAEERIRAVEARISKNAFETAIVFDKDGNIVFEKEGTEDEVKFALEEISKYKGYILTHNHPCDSQSVDFGVEITSSFSSDDLWIAYQQGLYEVRVVFYNEIYSFRWNKTEEQAVHRFLYEMDKLENDSETLIEAASSKLNDAFAKHDMNPNPQNYTDTEKAITAYYSMQKAQNDKINGFITSSQHIGYTFRRECIL